MVGDDSIIDMMETALRRFPFLDCLGAEPKDKRTLVAELDCSRSTVNRGIRELEALELVTFEDGGYRMTALGELVATDFVELKDTIKLRLQYGPFLKWMPEDEFDLALNHLRDAELLAPEPGNPYAMVNRHVRLLGDADEYRLLLPRTGLHGHETAHENIMDNGAQGELVVTPQIAETYTSDPLFAPLTEDMVESGGLAISVYPGEIPFYIGIIDNVVQIGGLEGQDPRTFVETRDNSVREWADNVYQEYSEAAEPLEISSPSPQLQ